MRQSPAHAAVALATALALTAPAPAAASSLAERALELLEMEAPAAGRLALDVLLRLEEGASSRPDLTPATLELRLPADRPPSDRLELGLAIISFETDPELVELAVELPPGAAELLVRLRLEVPEEVDRVAVAAALPAAGLWGAAEAELAGPAEAGDLPGGIVVERDLRAPTPAGIADAAPALRILPPTDQPVVGAARIRVLISDPGVDRVSFELDGEPVAEDAKPPFSAVIDFGPDGAVRELRAVGFDSGGATRGEDRITLNEQALGNRVRITEVRPEAGRVSVTAALELAGAAPAERLEFYLNGDRLQTLERPPWRADLARPEPGASDFVRVVAWLDDGTSIEDARLVDSPAERVEVNLVQVFAVVTDSDGVPRHGLERADFELRLDGRAQAIDRFAPAQEVPLVLGLVIDTSGSMWTLMPDTRMAGSRFLAQTLRDGDRAFLVDFDTRPRLAAGITDDLGGLLKRFAGLVAEGFTALYDAVIFSMLQFEGAAGRKALVVLTDGDDYKSRFGARRCIEYGRELGVPVYIIALGGMYGERRDIKRLDLESLAGSTGGRVFYIESSAALGPAYDRIEEELRSQYLLAFTTPRPLEPDELGKIRVTVRPRGLKVRSVAGAE